jgi:hypothetical protein
VTLLHCHCSGSVIIISGTAVALSHWQHHHHQLTASSDDDDDDENNLQVVAT